MKRAENNKRFQIKKARVLLRYEGILKSPYFMNLEYTDQKGLVDLKKVIEDIIRSVNNPIKFNKKEPSMYEGLFITMNLRMLVLSWYLIYCKSNFLNTFSWKKTKSPQDFLIEGINNFPI